MFSSYSEQKNTNTLQKWFSSLETIFFRCAPKAKEESQHNFAIETDQPFSKFSKERGMKRKAKQRRKEGTKERRKQWKNKEWKKEGKKEKVEIKKSGALSESHEKIPEKEQKEHCKKKSGIEEAWRWMACAGPGWFSFLSKARPLKIFTGLCFY